MFDSFSRWRNKRAKKYVLRGQGTGGWSKALSYLLFPLFAALVAVLVKNNEYWAVAIIIIFVFTKIGVFVILGILVYFITIKNWVGVSFLLVYYIINGLSYYVGRENVKKFIFQEKPMIDPFEGAADFLLWLFFQCVSLAGAILLSGWPRIALFVIFVASTVILFIRFLSRLVPRWRQIHYPLMLRYASIAGEEMGFSETEEKDFNLSIAIISFLQTIYPEKTEADLNKMFMCIKDKMCNFSDHDLLKKIIRRRNARANNQEIEGLLTQIREIVYKGEDAGLLIRYIIAEIIGEVFGDDERGLYLFAVFYRNI